MRRRSGGVIALGQPGFHLPAMSIDGFLARSATDAVGHWESFGDVDFAADHAPSIAP